MPIVELSEKIDGKGPDPWYVQDDALLITGRAISRYSGIDIVCFKDGLWVRSFYGGGGQTRYRTLRVHMNGRQVK